MPSTNGHGSEPERVALYLRVSSEEQRDRETIEIQREFLEQYRSLYELEVAEIYKDDGVSGTIPLHERPEGRKLLEAARLGKFGTILVKKLDRLGRTLLVILDAHDRLQEAGVALRSATEPKTPPTLLAGSSSRCSPASRNTTARTSERERRPGCTGPSGTDAT
jgi:DNA invertase Pin-like site-specific DNA recombinase